MVPLQHHRTPPENSEGMLFLLRTCLTSDNFSSFINAVWWPATYNNRKLKSQFLPNTHTHTHVLKNFNSNSWLFPKWKQLTVLCYSMLHAASSIHYGSLYLCSGIIIWNNQAHLFLSNPSIIFWSQPTSLSNSMLTHTPRDKCERLDLQAQLKLTFLQTTVWQ